MPVIYCGTLKVQTNAHVKPRGKRKRLRPDEMEFRDVHGVVWVGDDAEHLNTRSHTIGMVCRLCGIKNREAIRVVAIVNKKEIGKTNK